MSPDGVAGIAGSAKKDSIAPTNAEYFVARTAVSKNESSISFSVKLRL